MFGWLCNKFPSLFKRHASFDSCSKSNNRINSHDIREMIQRFLQDASIEVMPRTLQKVHQDFPDMFPKGMMVYVAHIEGTPIQDMQEAVSYLVKAGFQAIPHIPARSVRDMGVFEEWVRMYHDCGVSRALLLAGGNSQPVGQFASSLPLLESGMLEKYDYTHVYVAGHPEGNKDIDPDGSNNNAKEFLRKKFAYAEQSPLHMEITTQFCFDGEGAYNWLSELRRDGITLPVHFGVAGPTKLSSLMKYAIMCGVGPSMKVLQKRSLDVANLMLSFEPDEFLYDLFAYYIDDEEKANMGSIHIFPLGGIKQSAIWIARMLGDEERVRRLNV